MKVFTPKANPQPLNEYIYANPRDLTCVVSIHRNTGHNGSISIGEVLDCSKYYIKSAKIESTGVQGKIFGTTYCQKLSCTLIDSYNLRVQKGDLVELWFYPTAKNIDLTINNNNNGCPGLKNNENYMTFYNTYIVDSVKKNEKTGEISLIGYDYMNKAANTLFSLPNDKDTFTLKNILSWCENLLSRDNIHIDVDSNRALPTYLPTEWTREQINLSGEETVRDIFNAVAELCGENYFCHSRNNMLYSRNRNEETLIIGKALSTGKWIGTGGQWISEGFYTLGDQYLRDNVYIDKSKYFELTSDKPYKLTGITATNELNDSVSVGTDEYRQVIYNNPFLTLLPDETQQTILTGILNQLKDISITPFNCEWRGDPRLEPTDWLKFEDKKGYKFQSFLLNETVEYNGGFKSTMWVDKMESQTPIAADRNISTSILKTKATVDKVKGEITLEVSRAKDAEQLLGSRITLNENAITSEVKNRQDADSELSSTITQTATEIRQEVKNTTDGLDSKITQTANSISAEITARENADTELSTRITANENGITSEVSRATGKENELAADISTITQTVDNISTRIDTVEGNYSTINQTVNEISLEVGNKADADGGALISLINADTSTAKISADKITLEGEVSFVKKGDNVSELANDKGYLVGDDLGATGTTVIDGGRITTGIISANRLDLSGTLTVGSNISQLTNDTGYITTGDIPTKTSDLFNDSGFIDSSDTVDFAKLSKLKDADYTIINGGNITTGTIQAGVVFAGSLNGAEGNFTNLTTSGSISNGTNGFYINWYGSSGNAFVGYSTSGTGFAGLQFVPSLDQIYMIGGGNSILFNGSGTSYINLGTSSYISADRFITKNYGTSLPSSGSTGEVFYKVVS